MDIWQSFKWINRHGTSCALLILMLMLCAAAHSVASSMMALLSDIPFADLPPRLSRNIMGIEFLDTHWCFPLAYVLFSLGTLIYMEIRSTPQWAVWVSFVSLSAPAIAYLALCLRVGTVSVITMIPTHSP